MSDAKDFWVNAHKNSARGPLTGTQLGELLNYFRLNKKIKKDMHVLNIGVGLGHCTRGLANRCKVSALDICQGAVDKVSSATVAGYIHENLDQLPQDSFDMAISLLVTAHMPEADLVQQLTHVIRALKPDGKFYCQFSAEDNEAENNIPLRTVSFQKDPSVPASVQKNNRTMEYAKLLVDMCGGKVTFTSAKRNFPQHKAYWYYLVIQKA